MPTLHHSENEPKTHPAGSSSDPSAAPSSPVDQHKQAAHKEATGQKDGADAKTVFLSDGIAYANNYTVPNSQAWNICNPGLLTKAWDPAHGDLPTDGGALRYPDVDTGAAALHTFVGKILAAPASTTPPPPAGSKAPPPSLPFTPDMTIQNFAQVYAPTRVEDWVKLFTEYTGTTPDTKLSEVTA